MEKYRVVYMRGGTSKALVFRKEDLPQDKNQWDEIFLKAMGTPDPKQIDGMGGCTSSTSKIAVISPSERPDIDVDYTFFQVSIDVPSIAKNVNCGNISSVVGPFAIDEGMVKVEEPKTLVRIYNTNTDKVMEETVCVEDGKAAVYGDEAIFGVPGMGSRIDETFCAPGGSMTGKTFPTGKVREMMSVPGWKDIEVSIVDAATTVVFVKAEDVGLKGTELGELANMKDAMERLGTIRGLAAVRCGFVDKWEDAWEKTPAAPDVVIVSAPQSFTSMDKQMIAASNMDVCARALSMMQVHKAFPVTDSIATGTAAATPGTVVYDVVSEHAKKSGHVDIGHPSGLFPVTVKVNDKGEVEKATVVRTARRIMEGMIYIR